MKHAFVLFFLTSLLFASCISDNEEVPDMINYVEVGDVIPNFEIKENDGRVLSSNDFEGKRSIIVFFNTWCSNCAKELPIIEDAYKMLKEEPDFKMAAIARAETSETTAPYWTEKEFTMPKYHDLQKEVFFLFGNSYVPRIYLIDRDKKIIQMGIETFNLSAQQIVALVKAIP